MHIVCPQSFSGVVNSFINILLALSSVMYIALLFIGSGKTLLFLFFFFFPEYLYFYMLGWIFVFGHIGLICSGHSFVWKHRDSTTSLAQALQSSTSLLGADVFGTQAVTIPPPGMIFFYSF